MRTVLRTVLAAAALVSGAAVSHADTVRLKTGAILVGDVELAEDGDIVITTRFPEEGTFTLKRDQLEPRSLYDVLDRRTGRRHGEAHRAGTRSDRRGEPARRQGAPAGDPGAR